MSNPITVHRGIFVAPEAWLAAIRSAGFRCEFAPDDDTAVLGGEVTARFGHPSIASNKDVLVQVNVEFFTLPRVVPPEVVRYREQNVNRLRELDAPSSQILHESMVVAWITDGQPGVEKVLVETIKRHRARGYEDDIMADWLEMLSLWKKPSTQQSQTVLFEAFGATRAHFLAEWVLAAGYAHAADGELREARRTPLSGEQLLSASSIAALLSKAGGSHPDDKEEQLFSDWTTHAPS